jgi:excisionase family DNA binding protein
MRKTKTIKLPKETPPAKAPLFLGWRDLAAYLGISPNAAYRLVTSGEIPSFRVRGKLFVLQTEVDKYVESISGTRVA